MKSKDDPSAKDKADHEKDKMHVPDRDGEFFDETDQEKASPNESDVTEEDIEALGGHPDLSMDSGDDELLRHREYSFSGDDLDVPGADLDDNQENIGSEDEENNSYSIGSDRHRDLEEDQG